MAETHLVFVMAVFMTLFTTCKASLSKLKCENDTNSANESILPFCVMDEYDDKSMGSKVEVNIVAKIDDVLYVNDHEQTVKLAMLLSLSWIDYRLQLMENSSQWEKDDDDYLWTLLDLKYLDLLWTPDLDILNIKDFKIKEMFHTQGYLVLYGDKRLWYEFPVEIVLDCPLFDFDSFPFDVQICELWIGSYSCVSDDCTHIGNVLYNKTNQRTLKYNVDQIKALSFEEGIKKWKGSYFSKDAELTEYWYQYSYFPIRMMFTRRIESFLLHVYLPSTLLVIGTWFGFLIDPASVPGRVSLSLMLLLVAVNNG